MEKNLCKFCRYYVEENENDYEELKMIAKENNINFENTMKKSKKTIKTLKIKAERLGFDIDFESYCNMLEKYVNEKDMMNDNLKKEYLKLLAILSDIYEINLREELEKYVSYKEQKPTKALDKKEFINYCKQYFINNGNVPDKKNSELEDNAYKYLIKIEYEIKKLGFEINVNTFNDMCSKYLELKKDLSDKEKINYLKILSILAEIMGENLREKLSEHIPEKSSSLSRLLKSLSNPLTNSKLLKSLIYQRYNNGAFNVEELPIINEKAKITQIERISYNKIEAKLLYKLYSIFVDKLVNYAAEDLNSIFVNCLEENDLERLKELTEDDIYDFIKRLNHESIEDTCTNLNISSNLYKFINLSIETIDYKSKEIGKYPSTMFNSENNEITFEISLNLSEVEETYLLLNKYIRKCIENNLNYQMSILNVDNINKNSICLYANELDLIKKISILNNIKKTHPEWIDKVNIPLQNHALLGNSYYSISIYSINNNSYNEYFNQVSEISYYRILSKIILNKITNEKDLNIINDFINFENITIKQNILDIEFNNNSFYDIKDLINTYLPEIINTLKIYMEKEDKFKIIIKEFSKSLLYLSNLLNNQDKKRKSNIALGKYNNL